MNEQLKPLYPGLYGWQITYQLLNGQIAFCSCFQEALSRYFVYLREQLPSDFLKTHHRNIQGKKHLKLAFARFANSINPIALKTLFPECDFSSHPLQIIDGKEFFFCNQDIKAPELDENFWDAPEKYFLFRETICEVCNDRVPSHYYCHQMYGGPFIQSYGAWVKAETIRQGCVDYSFNIEKSGRRTIWRESENKIRTIVGIPKIGEKFVSETVLFKTIAYLLKGHEVIHHYRSDWLGRQELDIFVPSLNLAVEYQGEQHFTSIDAWGGDEALAKNQLRDEEKKQKCDHKGVKLIYFDYTMEMSEKFVARRLEKEIGKKFV